MIDISKLRISVSIIGLLVFIALVGGVSYGFFAYNKNVALISLEVGEMSIDFQNNGNAYNNISVVPCNDTIGMASSSYLDFTINGRVDTEAIKYELEIIPQEGSTIDTNHVKIYLTDQNDNEILSPYFYTELIDSEANSGKSILQEVIEPLNTNESRDVSKSYRLRVWVDNEYSEEINKTFNFELKIYAYNVNIDNYVKIAFDTGDGRNGLVKYALRDSKYDFLPTPIRQEYTFDGWSVQKDDVIVNYNDYVYLGNYEFNGTNYINTGVKLFSSENWSKNMYISIDIIKNTSTETSATLIGSKDESTNNYPGFVFRRDGSTNRYNVSANVSSSKKKSIGGLGSFNETKKVRFLRIGKKLYYSLNEASFTELLDFSSFSLYFDLPLTFGAAFNSDGVTLQRFFIGELSNMIVSFLDEDATLENYESHYRPSDIPNIIIGSSWHQSVIFDKITSNDIDDLDYIENYDMVIASYPSYSTQDTVKINNKKKPVYYYTGNNAAEHANVLFAGFCWQIVRTTDTGSIKVIYNGIAENDQCKTDRDYSGAKAIERDGVIEKKTLTGNRLYGRSYDYDLEAGTFTIKDSAGLPSVWSESDSNNNRIVDWKELIGTYTCDNTNSTCETLYYIGNYQSATQASSTYYKVKELDHYSQVGISQFQAYSQSLALAGYMFNTVYNWSDSTKEGTYVSDVTWNSDTNKYVVSSNTSSSLDNDHHYICEDADCTQVRYYYYSTEANGQRYILLENGETIESALKKMVNNTGDSGVNINVYNSAIKGYLDNWYAKNLINYTKYIDLETVYCNNRSAQTINGLNKTGDLSLNPLVFYTSGSPRDLGCSNITDRFSVNNNYAKLTYPVGLLTDGERITMGESYAMAGEKEYWLISPIEFSQRDVRVRLTSTSGGNRIRKVNDAAGVRPVISLKPDNRVISGDGSYERPYKIDTTS